MEQNIMITGAAGYIGGSIVERFSVARDGLVAKSTIHAVVRSDEQVKSLTGSNVKVFQADLDNDDRMLDYVVENEINIIIHTATSINEAILLSLMKALGARRKASGDDVYFIHTSGVSAFDTVTGWTFGEINDTDNIFKMEKELADSYVLRKVDVSMIMAAEKCGVKAITVMPVNIYGKGSGTWNKMSVHVPGYIRSSIKHRKVYKFAESRVSPMVHIEELVDFYSLLTEAVLRKDDVSTGEAGYFFIQSHTIPWWDLLQGIAEALHKRGLVDEPTTYNWPSEEVITESLGVPAAFAYSIWNSEARVTSVRAQSLGWNPIWNTERLMKSLDDEIDAALDLDANKTSLIRSVEHKSH